MNFEGFTTSQSSINIKKRYNKKKENYLKIFRTSYKQNDKKNWEDVNKEINQMGK